MEKMNVKRSRPLSGNIVGIDLGTTNCAVAVYSAQTVPTLLPIGEDGKYTVPSCVRWDGTDEDGIDMFTVGAEAYRERFLSNAIYSVKRIMGTEEKVVLTRDDGSSLTLSPAEVSAKILYYLKEKVAEFYGPTSKCVITVPAYFNQRQIEDTLHAAELASWDCQQILKEPTSASYIYSLLGYASNGSVLIYDLGGGTFDVTHMSFLRRDTIPSKLLTSLRRQYGIDINATKGDLNEQYFCRVLGTYGDVHLGGDDIDKAFGDYLIESQNLKLSDRGRAELYLKCEEFKKLGTFGMDIEIENIPIKLTMEGLNIATDMVFEKTLELMKDIDVKSISTIVLVGGSTKSQRIRDNLVNAFPGVEISAVLDPDATVAYGAGSVAKAIENKKGLMYADVLPLPIGILVDEKSVEVCIPRNTSMPYTVQRTYHTLYDNQERITLHLYQGLSSVPTDCTYLGRLTMDNIPKAPAGGVDVIVSFILTGQGTLRVRSNIEGTEREEELVIDNIFDVKQEVKSVAEESTIQLDEFEQCFIPMAKDNSKIMELFVERRELLGAGKDVAEVEDRIVSAVTSI